MKEVRIKLPLLAHELGFIDGKWTGALSGATRKVVNPATGETLAEVPQMGEEETLLAIEAASRALGAEPPLEERRRWLVAIGAAMLEHKAEIGRIITLEQGKPHPEAIGEVEYAAGFFSFFATQMDCLKPERLPISARGCRWTVHHRPAGVVGLLSSWNFPIAMMAKKLAAALGAGCAIVAKPATSTPLTMIAFWNLVERLDLAHSLKGRLNLVIGPGGVVGKTLCEHPAVRLVSCTGSTETGRALMRSSAKHIKRLDLELGGNAPFVVFDDADLEQAAQALIANKFRCSGQTCVCANRVFVQKAVEKEFLESFGKRMARLKCGDGMAPGTDFGPLIDRAGFDKVAAHVQDALSKGARLLLGGTPPLPPHDWGYFFPATLVSGATDDMIAFKDETFGPLVAVSRFETEEEVIERSNNTPYGLAAYVFTKDQARGARVCARLQYGHVGLNSGVGPTPEAPFGGMKQSGIGREGGREGLMEYVEQQVVAEP